MLISKVENLVKTLHKGQKDRGGVDYYEHLYTVANTFPRNDIKYIVGLLHDSLEDVKDYTPVKLKSDLLEIGFDNDTSDVILEAVILLSRNLNVVNYYENIKSNEITRLVKISDIMHNMVLSRLPKVTPKDLDRHLKYQEALNYLKG